MASQILTWRFSGAVAVPRDAWREASSLCTFPALRVDTGTRVFSKLGHS